MQLIGGLPICLSGGSGLGFPFLHHRRQVGYLSGRLALLAPDAVPVIEIADDPVQVHRCAVAARYRAADLARIDRQATHLLSQAPAAPLGEGHMEAVPTR